MEHLPFLVSSSYGGKLFLFYYKLSNMVVKRGLSLDLTRTLIHSFLTHRQHLRDEGKLTCKVIPNFIGSRFVQLNRFFAVLKKQINATE